MVTPAYRPRDLDFTHAIQSFVVIMANRNHPKGGRSINSAGAVRWLRSLLQR